MMIRSRPTRWGMAFVLGIFALRTLAALCAATLEARQAAADTSERGALAGLWFARQVPGPLVQGDLCIEVRGEAWQARIKEFTVPVARNGADLRFDLPDGNGRFRGRLEPDRRSILGHWIQPAGAVSYQPRATPVELVSSTGTRWTGTVAPLDETVHVYLKIRRRADGPLTGVIRCPENNRWGRSEFAVALEGNEVVLADGNLRIPGRFDRPHEELSLSLNPARPLVFRRCAEADAVGFYPRMPGRGAVRFQTPENVSDGWSTASLEDADLDSEPLRALMTTILDADPADPQAVPIHSILIARRGRLVLEEYFHGFHRERPHDMRSAGKTLAPLLIGVAREHGAKVEPSSRVADFFPEYRPIDHWDERKARLTVHDLMTMTSGLASDDNDVSSPGSEDRLQEQRTEPDWYRYTLNLPMRREPGGTSAVYSSASLNLVGGVAGRAAGLWNGDLFFRLVARPLRFGRYHLNLMPGGEVYAGGGAYLLPRDQLKIGQLYLDHGLWNGVRVLSEEWVRRSTEAHATFERPVIPIDRNHQYGYGWHIHHFTVVDRTVSVYAAEGNGGQLILVLPSLEMVVSVNGGGYGASSWYRWGLEVVPKYLIPAAASPRGS